MALMKTLRTVRLSMTAEQLLPRKLSFLWRTMWFLFPGNWLTSVKWIFIFFDEASSDAYCFVVMLWSWVSPRLLHSTCRHTEAYRCSCSGARVHYKVVLILLSECDWLTESRKAKQHMPNWYIASHSIAHMLQRHKLNRWNRLGTRWQHFWNGEWGDGSRDWIACDRWTDLGIRLVVSAFWSRAWRQVWKSSLI